jgi:3-phosphoshikimate 1-carboxyvinyltransferase
MSPRVKAADAGLFLPASQGLHGCLQVPGDKSISHRAVLLGAVSSGPVAVQGFLCSEDTMATVAAVRALGVEIHERGGGLVVHGHGWDGLREPQDVIDAANSGTLIRLLPGLVASREFLCVLTGDASILRRPMDRVLQPVVVDGGDSGRARGQHVTAHSSPRR